LGRRRKAERRRNERKGPSGKEVCHSLFSPFHHSRVHERPGEKYAGVEKKNSSLDESLPSHQKRKTGRSIKKNRRRGNIEIEIKPQSKSTGKKWSKH